MNLHRHTFWNASPALSGDIRHAFGRYAQQQEAVSATAKPRAWAPRVDVREEDKRFVIVADVPGVDPSSIEVSMEKNVLSIRGERASVAHAEAGSFTRQERAQGVFHRSFALPDSADAEGISANGKHGVLEIVIPKKAESSPRRITINAGH